MASGYEMASESGGGTVAWEHDRSLVLDSISRHEQNIGALNERTNLNSTRLTRLETTIKVWAAGAALVGSVVGSVVASLLIKAIG